ncbi:MAG: transcriptional activator NhaR [Methylococcaceae bacterium]
MKSVPRLNYQHLYYFWNVAREESVTRASEKLHLAQPTISGQLAALEKALGQKLFEKTGRRLALTDIGRIVFHYADEIFNLGQELSNTLNGHPGGRALRLVVGVSDALPKLIARRLIEPVFQMTEPTQILCYEDKTERLLAEMSWQGIDLVLSDAPLTLSNDSKARNHRLGDCAVTVFGTEDLLTQYRPGFPRSLDQAPFLLPTGNTALRRSLDQWFHDEAITPNVRAEIEDSGLLKTFGSGGTGLFVAPSAVETEICHQYGVGILGRIESVRETFYAVTLRRQVQHPAVTAILEQAPNGLF